MIKVASQGGAIVRKEPVLHLSEDFFQESEDFLHLNEDLLQKTEVVSPTR